MKRQDLEANLSAANEAISAALKAYEKYKSKVPRDDYIIVVNFREPSYRKRLYVYALKENKIIRTHHVSHGVNSSSLKNRAKAVRFGNVKNSKRSSLGAMLTAEIYYGKHGRSMRLDGLEKGINDNVRSRYIVLHSASYVTDGFILTHRRAGQSEGCFVVDPAISNDLIDLIHDGCMIYAFY